MINVKYLLSTISCLPINELLNLSANVYEISKLLSPFIVFSGWVLITVYLLSGTLSGYTV